MRRFVFSIIFSLSSFAVLFAQEMKSQDVLHLKNGEVFKGMIMLKTDDVVVLNTDDGKRYQFQLSDIEKLGQEIPKTRTEKNKLPSSFATLVELNGGISSVPIASFQTTPMFSCSVALGSKDTFGTNTFAGIGLGYEAVFSKSDKTMSFLPIFVQIHKNLSNKPINPYVGMKSGYALCFNDEFTGGAFVCLALGINFRLADEKSFNLGLLGKIQSVSGTIIERNELGEFTTQGSTPMYTFGLNIGFIF